MSSSSEIEKEWRALETKHEAKRRRRRKRWRGVGIFMMLMVLVAGGTVYYWWNQGSRGSGVHVQGETSVVPNRLIVLAMGMDAIEPNRTDTMQLISVDSESGHLGILSIPRDTRVLLPGYGNRRINEANALGGADLAIQAVEDLLGVRVDYWMRVDFSGFEQIVDAIGGVTIDIPERMQYTDTAQDLYIDLPAGRQHLNGEQALHYVRYRDGLGDVSLINPRANAYGGRITRQLKLVQALVKEALKGTNLFQSPQTIVRLMDLLDTNMSIGTGIRLAGALSQIDFDTIDTQVLPGRGETIGGASYWVYEPALVREAVNRVVLGRDGLVQVQVLNGNGMQGAAQAAADRLRLDGYFVVAVGNADHFGYGDTQVIAQNGDIAGAQAIAQVLGSGAGIAAGSLPSELMDAEAEYVIILGADYRG